MSSKVNPYVPKPYYARVRTYWTTEGDVSALTTRYTADARPRKRKTTGPRGGIRYDQYFSWTYYAGGRFYRAANIQDEGGTWHNSLAPVNGWLHEIPASNRNTKKNEAIPVACILCRDGYPIMVSIDGETYEVHDYDWPMMAEVLGLEAPQAAAA